MKKQTAAVKVAVYSRLNHDEKAAPDKLTIELIPCDEYYIVLNSSIVSKIYVDAFEFLEQYKQQEEACKELLKMGVAIFEFTGYNKFTLDKKENVDYMYERMARYAKERAERGW